ncbi:MAG: hypothetical protein L6R36_006712 [Xanthoria steineri]|nr:MAG: hypothetical protein L6R36_006712 [Xanthoria steineri]
MSERYPQMQRIWSDLPMDREDNRLPASDTASQLWQIHTLSFASQDKAFALIASPRLQAWLTRPSSSMLLVNGQMFSNDAEAPQSPLSYFCARLIDNVLNRSHPAGILISILSRLIHQIVESPAPVTLTDVSILDKLVREEDLSCMFERLVGVLPAGTVLFCVLDGLSYYEAKKRGKDCMDLLTMLARLTRRRPETIHGPMVKLLVTAPLGTYAIHEFFGEEQKLNLDPYYTSHGGFSAKYWDVRMGGAIEN